MANKSRFLVSLFPFFTLCIAKKRALYITVFFQGGGRGGAEYGGFKAVINEC